MFTTLFCSQVYHLILEGLLMKLSKMLSTLAFVASLLNIAPLQCMLIEPPTQECNQEEIDKLADVIDCSNPKTLCNSVHKLTQENQSPLISDAIRVALERSKQSILNRHAILMQSYDGETALHFACVYGYTECAQALIDAAKSISDETLKALLLSINRNRDTALHNACWKGHTACAQVLIDAAQHMRDATLHRLLLSQDYADFPALHHACVYGHTACADLLRESIESLGYDIAHKNPPLSYFQLALNNCWFTPTERAFIS